MKLFAILLCALSFIVLSEQRVLRKLDNTPDCDIVEIGFQTCKNDLQYYECAVDIGLVIRFVSNKTVCCPDNERDNRIFMAKMCGMETRSPSTVTANVPTVAPNTSSTKAPHMPSGKSTKAPSASGKSTKAPSAPSGSSKGKSTKAPSAPSGSSEGKGKGSKAPKAISNAPTKTPTDSPPTGTGSTPTNGTSNANTFVSFVSAIAALIYFL